MRTLRQATAGTHEKPPPTDTHQEAGALFCFGSADPPGAHYSASATIVPFFFVAALTITIATAETRMPINVFTKNYNEKEIGKYASARNAASR